MTPLYLGIIYYKIVTGADLLGLFTVTFIIAVFYLPLKALLVSNGSELTLHSLFKDEDIEQYLNSIFYFVIIFIGTGILLSLLSLFLDKNDNISFIVGVAAILIVYFSWASITMRYGDVMALVSTFEAIKMFGIVLFLMVLFVAIDISEIRQSGFDYILSLVFIVFKDIIIILLAFPGFFMAVYEAFGIKSSSTKKKSDVSIIGILLYLSPGLFLFGFIFFSMFIEWFSDFINDFNAYYIAFSITALMMIVSAYGTLFQVRLFMGSFFDNQKKALQASFVFVAVFYGAMIIHINLLDSINHNTHEISSFQHSIEEFNRSFQQRFKNH